MRRGHGWGGQDGLMAVLFKIITLLVLSGVASSTLAVTYPITNISVPTTSYTAPATIKISYSINTNGNDFVKAELKDGTGSLVQTLSDTSGTVTISGVTTNQSYQVNTTVQDPNTLVKRSAASNVVSITVTAAATQSITFPVPLNTTYGAGAVPLSATASSGMAVTYVSNSGAVCGISGSSATNLGAGPCSITANQAGGNGFAAASATQTFTIAKANQTITFAQPVNQVLGAAPFGLSVSVDSPLGVSLSSSPTGVCTVTGTTVTLGGTGTCTITASQSGNANYNSATSIARAFTVAPSAPANLPITFTVPATVYFSPSPVAMNATTNPPVTISYSSSTNGVCTVSGSSVNLVSVGTCTITASQSNNPGYNSSSSTKSFTVAKGNQTISINSITSKTLGTAPFGVSAIVSSQLVPTFGTSTPSICFVSGSTVTLSAYGTCTITADQDGNDNYNRAPQTTQSFNVAYAPQTIAFGALDRKTYGDAPFTVSATVNSPLTVVFSSQTSSVCSVFGTTVSIQSAGTCTITASQQGDGYYGAAPQVAQSFTVSKGPQTITFSPLPIQSLSNPTFTVLASASSTLPVRFSSTTTEVCTVTGAIVSLRSTGTCTIAADQEGDANFSPASQMTQSATVVAAGTPGNGAARGSQTIPGALRAGQPYTITVVMTNTGSSTWTETAKIRLGAQNPQDSRQWTIAGRALLPPGVAVSTGQSYAFQVPVTAPTTPGTYSMQWRMVQDGVEWFGETTTNATITVTANTGPSATLSATPTNARMVGGNPVTVTFAGSGAETGRIIKKLELFQGTGQATGYVATPINTVTGGSNSLVMDYTANLTAGSYWYKLRTTDDQNTMTESPAVVVNISNSSLLGQISGVRIDSSNKPWLVGWVCQPGVSQSLAYEVIVDAPTLQTGGKSLAVGTASSTTEPDNQSVQSQCGTPNVGHHFTVDLSALAGQYAGHTLYVQATAYSGGGTIVLPCADNSCAVPGAIRIAMIKPLNNDAYAGPTTVFMNAQISGSSGPYDDVAFSVDGSWIAATADASPGVYYATSSVLPVRSTPYQIQARVRQGGTTVYAQSMANVVDGSNVSILQTSPSNGSSFSQGSTVALGATTTNALVKSLNFYANGAFIGAASGTGGTWAFSWVPNVPANYMVTAQAFDTSGHLISTSGGISVTITEVTSALPSTPIPVVVSVPHLGNPDAGSLPGNLTVDPRTGAATYSIGIVVPPGTAGMVPELALNYSSAGTNGIAGLGWSLSGPSSIHRCGKTIAQDGVNRSINLDTGDRLCLDGQRLVRVNAPAPADSSAAAADLAYWAAGGEYRTEIESLNKVTAIGGPTIAGASSTIAFKVRSKDGKTRYYGCDVGPNGCVSSNIANSYVAATSASVFTTDAANGGVQDASKIGKAVSWALSSIVDTSRNHIDFEYTNAVPSTGEYLLSQIRYGGNYGGTYGGTSFAEQSAYAAVRFTYEARADAWTRYVADVHNDQRSRLAAIKTYVNTAGTLGDKSGTMVRSYGLAYDVAQSPSLTSGRSLLTSVTVCATTDTNCLPPTKFNWGAARSSVQRAFVSATSGSAWGGAGIGDCATNGSNAAPCLITHAATAGNHSPGQFHPDYFDFSDFEMNGRVDVLEKRVADPSSGLSQSLGGIALIDAQTSSNPSVAPGTMQQSYRYFHNTGTGFVKHNYKISTNEFFAVLAVADFNGDGFPDVLVATSDNSGAGGDGASTPKVCLNPLANSYNPDTGAVIEVSGDLIFDCAAGVGIKALGQNTSPGMPTVVDVVGDGRASIYGPNDWSNIEPVASLCSQGTCWSNQGNLPLSLRDRNIPIDVLELFPMFSTYVQFEQMVDYSGTGKPEMTSWTKAYQGRATFGYDPSPCPATNADCLIWHNLTPQVIVNAFTPPGAAPAPALAYTHYIANPVPGRPYLFDSTINMGTLSADFNGSGYSGLFYGFYIFGKNASNSIVTKQAQGVQCLSTGQHLDCTVRKALSTDVDGGASRYMRTLSVADFDGDGQPDLLMVAVDTLGHMTGNSLQLCHLLGDDTTKGSSTSDSNVSCAPWGIPGLTTAQLQGAIDSSNNAFHDQLMVMDMLGTGRPQLVFYHAGSYGSDGVWHEDGRWEVFAPADLAAPNEALDRIVSVTNGYGAKDMVTYVDGLATGTVSRANLGVFVYPQRSVPRTGKIANSLTTSNGGGRIRSKFYRYYGAGTNQSGRGSLGFQNVWELDPDSHVARNIAYHIDYPYVGMVDGEFRSYGPGTMDDVINNGTQIYYHINTLQTYAPADGKTACPRIVDIFGQQNELDGLPLKSFHITRAYSDGWCNLTHDSTNNYAFRYGAYSSFDSHVVVTDTTYDNDNTGWFIGRPKLVVKKGTAAGSSVTRTVAYTYDLTTGLLDSETTEPSNALLSVVTTYNRAANPFGLVNKQIQSWTDPACQGNTVTPACSAAKTRNVVDVDYAPSTKGRFPSTSRNALQKVQTLQFDAATGAMTSVTDPNNRTVTRTVDGFGRVTAERHDGWSGTGVVSGNEVRSYFKSCVGDSICPADAVLALITDTFHGSSRMAAPSVVYKDSAGHELRALTWAADGRTTMADKAYDSLGQLQNTYWPRYEGEAAIIASVFRYDDLGRVTDTIGKDETNQDAGTHTVYHGTSVVKTNALNQVRTETVNAQGLMAEVQVQDTQTNITKFTYDGFGNMRKATDPEGNVSTVTYDLLGRKISLADPDLGLFEYSVDPIGQVWAQRSPNQRAATPIQGTYFVYDLLGRPTSRWEPDLESHWEYDGAANGIGQLSRSYTIVGGQLDYERVHAYDPFGLPLSTAQRLSDGTTYTTYSSVNAYDAWNRLITQTYQRGSDAAKVFDTRYGSFGYPKQLQRGTAVLWKMTAQDASLRPTGFTLGNGVVQTREYNGYTGWLSEDTATLGSADLIKQSYHYDGIGNVKNRSMWWDSGVNQQAFAENFTYDQVNRLWTSQVSGQTQQVFTYTPSGNVLTKTGVGSGNYIYPSQAAATLNRPHAVQSITGLSGAFTYDANGNLKTAPGRTGTWTSFDMPNVLTKGSLSSTFVYGPEHQRTRQTRVIASDTINVTYAGAQEVEKTSAGQVTVRTYWPMGVGVEIDRPGASAPELNWMHVDRLGNVVALTNQNGALVEKLEYDSWGKRRTINGSATPDTLDGQQVNRGFTGHEMLDQLDLVHMNGRVYDPYTAKFLSADPHVTDPTNGQNFNRYSYVLNNPTNLTDPTGFSWRDLQLRTGWGSSSPSSSGNDEQKENGGTQQTSGQQANGQQTNQAGTAKPEVKLTGGTSANSGGFLGWLKSVYAGGGGSASEFQQGGAYEVNQMGDPVNPNHPGVGAAQVATGAVLVGGVVAVAPEVVPIARVIIRGRRAAEEDSVPQVGGAHSEVQGIAGNESHHMPANSVSPLSKNKGPAISMRKNDHKETASWGSSRDARAYRAEQAERIKNGDFRGAQNMDIEDIQSKFGAKYDEAIRQLQEYTKGLGF